MTAIANVLSSFSTLTGYTMAQMSMGIQSIKETSSVCGWITVIVIEFSLDGDTFTASYNVSENDWQIA